MGRNRGRRGLQVPRCPPWPYERLIHVCALGFGSALGALAHRALALSVLAYVMRVRPPRDWTAVMKATARELMPGRMAYDLMGIQPPSGFAVPSTLVSAAAYTLLELLSAGVEPLLHAWRVWRLSAVALIFHRPRTEFLETEGFVDNRA